MVHRVCVIGGATWDVLFTTPQADLIKVGRRGNMPVLALPYGSKVDVTDIKYGFGGGAANVAVSLARLGVTVDIVTRLGVDWCGHEVVKNLRKFGVGVEQIQKDRRERTALAFIITAGRGHDHVAFVARGATRNLNLPRHLSAKYQWLYLTAVDIKDWPTRLTKLCQSFYERGGRIFWNPGTTQLAQPKAVANLLKYVSVIDLNNDEAVRLVENLKGSRPNHISSLTKSLHALGAELALVTAGSRGAYLFNGAKLIYHPIYRVKPVNTTGAGDAFGAGWLAGYLASGGNLNVAMQWGMLNSNSVIMHVGAQNGILSLSTLPKFRAEYDPT